MDNFRDIIKKIKICRNRGTSEEVISCLKDLFYEIGDGMVAYALGEELEKIGKFEEALKYFAEAEVRFPWPKYQDMARIARERVKRKIESEDLKKESRSDQELTKPSALDSKVLPRSLIITACTKEKIWDVFPEAPDYVPAIMAYTGKGFQDFLKWVRMEKINEKGCFWFILSGKYGFIEPWHPISYYDINIDNPDDFPITDDALVNQVNQKRSLSSGSRDSFRLSDFKKIICVNCPPVYVSKIKKCFPEGTIYNIRVG
jgi:hypothetical protein